MWRLRLNSARLAAAATSASGALWTSHTSFAAHVSTQPVARDSVGVAPPLVQSSSLKDVQVVGGHGGILGDGKYIYKPLQTGRRGRAEALFYETVFGASRVDRPPATFMPRFCGIELRRASGDGGDTTAYLVLEDIAANYRRPAIMDVKIGQQVRRVTHKVIFTVQFTETITHSPAITPDVG